MILLNSLKNMPLFFSNTDLYFYNLLHTGEVLEIGAQWSIRVKDIPSFERYISQLKTYYSDYGAALPPSQRLYPLLGLNLLRLLSQNKISEFHTELEHIDADQLLNNIYIKHPIQIEQCLMEGSYNKVWNSRANVPAPEYGFFVDILMGTIRNEIASCSEKAYAFLPLADAATLLYFKSKDELARFCTEVSGFIFIIIIRSDRLFTPFYHLK